MSRYLGYQGNSHSLTHYFTSHCISEACFCITRSTGLVLLEIGYWDISYLKLLIFTQILCRYDAKALLTVFFSVIWGGFQIGQAAPYIGKSIHRKAIYIFFSMSQQLLVSQGKVSVYRKKNEKQEKKKYVYWV